MKLLTRKELLILHFEVEKIESEIDNSEYYNEYLHNRLIEIIKILEQSLSVAKRNEIGLTLIKG